MADQGDRFRQHDFVNDFHDSHPFVYDYDWAHLDSPELAKEVWTHLKAAGIKAKRTERGVDHGMSVLQAWEKLSKAAESTDIP